MKMGRKVYSQLTRNKELQCGVVPANVGVKDCRLSLPG